MWIIVGKVAPFTGSLPKQEYLAAVPNVAAPEDNRLD